MRGLNLRELFSLLGRLALDARSLSRAPYLPPERMRERQFARLRALVNHAYGNIPCYRQLYDSAGFKPGDLRGWDDFHRLPVVTKEMVIENYPHAMLRPGTVPEDYIVSRSSGSSGKVLDIAYNREAMTTYILAALRLYGMAFPYRPWHSQAYIYTSPYPLNSLFGLYPLRFFSTLAPLGDVATALKSMKPDLLVCYPSHLKQLAAQLGEDAPRLGLRAVSTNSEMSTQAERDYLSGLFRCPVQDEYSSEELTRIAAQCVHEAYHVFEDINYMEVLDEKDRPAPGQGILVGTNLHNFAMPMIRYRQNDLGRLEASQCSCGRRFRLLTGLEGRRNDSFVLPSGKELTSGFLLDATYEFLLAYREAVADFCLIQETAAEIVLQVVPGQGWSPGISSAIADRFRGFLEEGVVFRIQEAEVCEKTTTGKRNPIINRMRRSGQLTKP